MLAAGVEGLRLRSWRYGKQTPGLIEEALARDHWSEQQWQKWRSVRLAEILAIARRQVPHYVRAWSIRDDDEGHSWRGLGAWPVLSKASVRASPESFLTGGRARRDAYRESTSGTTGTPLRLWWSREAVRGWYALNAARVLAWNGVDSRARWGIFGGRLVAPADQHRPPFWVWNAPMRQLYLSSYHLRTANIPAYLDALRTHRIEYLWGYPSALYELARSALDQGLAAGPLRFVVVNAEPLSPHQRATISTVFGCPVRETYGLAEIVAAASECERGTLHTWPEVGVIEVLADDSDREVPAGEVGRLVCTGLLNRQMPLVRYDTGDRVCLASGGECGCGRRLPILARVEGRADDVIVTPSGRRVGRLDPVFKTDLPVREAQIVQETIDRLTVRVVPEEGFGDRHAREIEGRLAQRVGAEMRVTVETAEEIERGPAGKFRAVISKL